jgi:hypothetical protein
MVSSFFLFLFSVIDPLGFEGRSGLKEGSRALKRREKEGIIFIFFLVLFFYL